MGSVWFLSSSSPLSNPPLFFLSSLSLFILLWFRRVFFYSLLFSVGPLLFSSPVRVLFFFLFLFLFLFSFFFSFLSSNSLSLPFSFFSLSLSLFPSGFTSLFFSEIIPNFNSNPVQTLTLS